MIHLCGHAIKKLCERAYSVFNEVEFERLSTISVSHLYNLRKSTTYCRIRQHFEKTKPKKSSIGERRKPQPKGQPGYIRIDTVHQGDQDSPNYRFFNYRNKNLLLLVAQMDSQFASL